MAGTKRRLAWQGNRSCAESLGTPSTAAVASSPRPQAQLRTLKGPCSRITMASFFRPSRLLSTLQRTPLRPTLFKIGALLTWYPMFIFFHDHVGQIMWVTGQSMYPFLNTDYNNSTRKEAVFVHMFNPTGGLKRGMIVAFW